MLFKGQAAIHKITNLHHKEDLVDKSLGQASLRRSSIVLIELLVGPLIRLITPDQTSFVVDNEDDELLIDCCANDVNSHRSTVETLLLEAKWMSLI